MKSRFERLRSARPIDWRRHSTEPRSDIGQNSASLGHFQLWVHQSIKSTRDQVRHGMARKRPRTVELLHRVMLDDRLARPIIGNVLPCSPPRKLAVGELGEVIAGKPAVHLTHHRDNLRARGGQLAGISHRPDTNRPLATVHIPQRPGDRTITPGLDGVEEQRLVQQCKMPRLAVIHELLQAHGVHRADLRQNCCSDVMRVRCQGRSPLPRLPPSVRTVGVSLRTHPAPLTPAGAVHTPARRAAQCSRLERMFEFYPMTEKLSSGNTRPGGCRRTKPWPTRASCPAGAHLAEPGAAGAAAQPGGGGTGLRCSKLACTGGSAPSCGWGRRRRVPAKGLGLGVSLLRETSPVASRCRP